MKKILLWILTVICTFIFSLHVHAEINFSKEVIESKQVLLLADTKNWAKYQKAIDALIITYSKEPEILSKIYKKLAKVKTKLGDNNPVWSKNYKIMAIVDYLNYSIMNEISKSPKIISAEWDINLWSLSDWYYIRKKTDWSIYAEAFIINWKYEWTSNGYHTNWKLAASLTYKNGVIEWESYTYTPLWELNEIITYESNKIVSIRKYDLSVIDSSYKSDTPSHSIEYFYNKDELLYKTHHYNKMNRKMFTFHYNKEAVEHWITSIYYDTEKNNVEYTYTVINWVEEGESIWYNEDWSVKSKAIYSKWDLNGMYYTYDKKWWILSETNFLNWEKHWEEKVYLVNTSDWSANTKVWSINIYENWILKKTTIYSLINDTVVDIITY